jgi:exosortase
MSLWERQARTAAGNNRAQLSRVSLVVASHPNHLTSRRFFCPASRLPGATYRHGNRKAPSALTQLFAHLAARDFRRGGPLRGFSSFLQKVSRSARNGTPNATLVRTVVNPESVFISSGCQEATGPSLEQQYPQLATAPSLSAVVPSPPRGLNFWLVAVLVTVTGALYAPVLFRLSQDWWSDPDYGHGMLVPIFSAYVIWRGIGSYGSLPWRPARTGLAVIYVALGLLAAGLFGAELFLSRVSLLVLIAGIVLALAGRPLLSAIRFPLLYLLFMIPLPRIIYNQITFPLQLFTSRLAADCLRLAGIAVLREGNLVFVPHYSLEVAQACSGIRSLMSLVALAVAYGYFAERRLWVRIALAILMVPVAILCNGFRVFGSGFLGNSFGPELAEGFFHTFSGWLIFLTAALVMFSMHGAFTAALKKRRPRKNG